MTVDELILYLEAKAALDRRSLNPHVFEIFRAALAGAPEVEIIDLGTGTGAMLRHLALHLANPRLVLTGVEREAALAEAAVGLCRKALEEAGWRLILAEDGFEARRGGCWRKLRFVNADGLAFDPKAPCQAVCAHTFMDLVPLARTLAKVKGWLVPGGVFYATCNYDGGTALFPAYSDLDFEAELLARYDRSMELRRVGQEATGGALCGRRLHQALLTAGWEVLGFGSSDWNLTPVRGGYRDADAVVLEALLAMIRGEGEGLEERALEAWHQERLAQLRAGRLGLIVHQLDLVAVRP
ncbi:hypothetical protein JCM13664_10380 [Methylothermus subterraneus]